MAETRLSTLDASFLEQVAQPRAEQIVVVHEQDTCLECLRGVRFVAQLGLPGRGTGNVSLSALP